MNRLSIRALVMLAALLLLGQGRARAEMVDYSYAWSSIPTPPVVTGGTGSVSFALTPNASTSSLLNDVNPTFIPAATVTTSSAAGGTDKNGSPIPPDSFSASYSLKLHLTDTASSQAGDLTFKGTISGQLTSNSSTLTSTFLSPLTQPLTLGSHVYSVTIDPTQINLPAPGAGATALIDALIMVSAVQPGGGGGAPGGGGGGVTPPSQTPEPSSLVLGCIALSLAGLAARRRRRARMEGLAI